MHWHFNQDYWWFEAHTKKWDDIQTGSRFFSHILISKQWNYWPLAKRLKFREKPSGEVLEHPLRGDTFTWIITVFGHNSLAWQQNQVDSSFLNEDAKGFSRFLDMSSKTASSSTMRHIVSCVYKLSNTVNHSCITRLNGTLQGNWQLTAL